MHQPQLEKTSGEFLFLNSHVNLPEPQLLMLTMFLSVVDH